MLLDVVQREIRIARRFGQAVLEIRQCFWRDKVVVLQHAGHALADDVGRKQFGERRGDRFQQALFAHEVQIGLHREARARQQGTARFDQLAWQAQCVG